ncbi:hypothetical protein [Pectobacterium jejuense]|uniref:hypothetical protein n=1 Tax=Pectobacterium jejuense TaxID=2974022 RepID=UPI002282D644|nr:hypothetical protein [Pectobacterium jejuense]
MTCLNGSAPLYGDELYTLAEQKPIFCDVSHTIKFTSPLPQSPSTHADFLLLRIITISDQYAVGYAMLMMKDEILVTVRYQLSAIHCRLAHFFTRSHHGFAIGYSLMKAHSYPHGNLET